MPPANPWLGINWSHTIAPCDWGYPVNVRGCLLPFGSPHYVAAIHKSHPSSGLTFDYFPEPYFGDINSNVYCLNMNPGGLDPAFTRSNDSMGTLESYMQGILNHNITDSGYNGCIYDAGKPIFIDVALRDQILNSWFSKHKTGKGFCALNPRPHVGTSWLREKSNSMFGALGRNPNLFFIEYFPYHSNKGFPFPNYLPSYDYRNWLIEQAMNNGKTIIILRQERRWYSIPGIGSRLSTYSNKYVLKCPAGAWLTIKNICKGSRGTALTSREWNSLLSML